MKKAIVTGGAGFIGSHIVEKLLETANYQVTVIDNLSTGKKENLTPFLDRIRFLEGDILDRDLLREEFKDTVVIFHQAAIPSVVKSIEDPVGTEQVNVQGSLNVFELAKERNVKRVVYASSCAVYGDSPELPKKENMALNPLSPYASHKKIVEEKAHLFNQSGLETIGLRYFNVFGPRQDMYSDYAAVIPIFLDKIAKNESPTIYGDGGTTRDFVFVKDIAQANILAASVDSVAGQVFNIGTGAETSLNKLVEKINKLLNKDIAPVYNEFRPGDIQRSRADISLAQQELKYNPTFDFEAGLKMCLINSVKSI